MGPVGRIPGVSSFSNPITRARCQGGSVVIIYCPAICVSIGDAFGAKLGCHAFQFKPVSNDWHFTKQHVFVNHKLRRWGGVAAKHCWDNYVRCLRFTKQIVHTQDFIMRKSRLTNLFFGMPPCIEYL